MQLQYTSNSEKIFACVNFLMEGRERREEVGTGDGRNMGCGEVEEQTLGSPVSQRVEVWIGSGVCTEDG